MIGFKRKPPAPRFRVMRHSHTGAFYVEGRHRNWAGGRDFWCRESVYFATAAEALTWLDREVAGPTVVATRP